MNNGSKITNFTDLNAWKIGHELVLLVYKLTEKFPLAEKFGLVDQMRRAATSITSNIAEGFTRRGVKEKIQFYLMAKGSLTELQNQIYIAKDVGYLDPELFQEIMGKSVVVHKLLTGLIKGVHEFSNHKA